MALVASGCAGRPVPPGSENGTWQQTALAEQLAGLAANAAPEERDLLAREVLRESHALANSYRMTRPALLHNVLVNTGLRDRGLCWHWTQDLLAHLRSLPLPSYQLHWAVAHRGKLFREHNSVVVTARGADLESGLVLDPWREAGALSWVSVSEDSYPWEVHRGISADSESPASARSAAERDEEG